MPVTTPETLLPLTVNPAMQLNILTKETEEMLEDIKYQETTEMPEGVTQTNEPKPKQIGASSVKPVPVCTNDIEDMSIEESSVQEILTDQFKESRSEPPEKDHMTCSTVSDDHKQVETRAPTQETKSVSQEDKALVTILLQSL